MREGRIVSRRTVLHGLSAVGALAFGGGRGAATLPDVGQTELRLGTIAASKALLFGSCVRRDMLPADTWQWSASPYGQMMLHQCDVITCAYMHWANYTERHPTAFDYSAAEPLVDWARTNGKKVRGHSLCWYAHAPKWLAESGSRHQAIDLLRRHILTVAGHFAGEMHSWDVVNEGLEPRDGLSGGLRAGIFANTIGADWMHLAFAAAREADPSALLTYNEYGIELTGHNNSDRKREALLAFLDDFRARRIPIDAIGIQSHLWFSSWKYFDQSAFARFLSDVASRGVQIFVTELDVIDTGTPTDAVQRDRVIAGMYKDYLSVVVENPSVTTIVGWGLSDREAWQNTNDLPSFRRNDGTAPRPMPFDAGLQPKPAAYAIADVLKAAPSR